MEETVVLPARSGPVPPGPPPEVPRKTPPPSEERSGNPAPQTAGIPPDVFQAVMNWIAAAPTSAHGESAPANLTETAPATASAPTAPPVPASPVAPEGVSVKIPDRVIQIAEEHIHVDTSPPPPPMARDEAPRRAAVPSDGPVRVSIGTIQVRIESPATPAPAPARPSRPLSPIRAATSPVRAGGFSQLRRHYIIPH